MNWRNVKLIFAREVRDQLRDRRTLFMIAVLPLFLYPLLGMTMFQIAQFVREHTTQVLIVNPPDTRGLPPLVEGKHFSARLYHDPSRQELVELHLQTKHSAAPKRSQFEQLIREGKYEAVVYFPSDFDQRLARFRRALGRTATPDHRLDIPSPEIYHDSAKEKSQVTFSRVSVLLERWTEAIGRQNLAERKLPAAAAKPFTVAMQDVATGGRSRAAMWWKILPFVVLIWSLTGAFYPAIDLCAGEKERGTLETLLSSPAERSEIVWGKLLTVMLFSVATAVLNLICMGFTGWLMVQQLPGIGLPPLIAFVWLLVALLPVSALFSALCLALAAFARSTKEGQYYLTPLLLVTLPLTILPMAPGVELNLGNSLIPITGVMLLLRTLLEGSYAEALPYVPIVVGITLACCLFAIRWAADQFNSETVLFRESERFDLSLWVKHLLRDREATPSVAGAIFCGMLILMVRFFMSFSLPMPQSFHDFASIVVVTQLVVIATPALLMTVMLTASVRQTLLLRWPGFAAVAAAALLAVGLHPWVHALQSLIMRIYPISDKLAAELNRLVVQTDNLWLLVLVIGIVPAFCEELAFRGFVLSGLRHMGHKWRAIVISSLFFAVTHAIFQQSIVACLVGFVIGFLAVQTGSILPCMVFHMIHNSLAVLAAKSADLFSPASRWAWLVVQKDGALEYQWSAYAIGGLTAIILLRWFQTLPYDKTPEESLQDALEHQTAGSLAG